MEDLFTRKIQRKISESNIINYSCVVYISNFKHKILYTYIYFKLIFGLQPLYLNATILCNCYLFIEYLVNIIIFILIADSEMIVLVIK